MVCGRLSEERRDMPSSPNVTYSALYFSRLPVFVDYIYYQAYHQD